MDCKMSKRWQGWAVIWNNDVLTSQSCRTATKLVASLRQRLFTHRLLNLLSDLSLGCAPGVLVPVDWCPHAAENEKNKKYANQQQLTNTVTPGVTAGYSKAWVEQFFPLKILNIAWKISSPGGTGYVETNHYVCISCGGWSWNLLFQPFAPSSCRFCLTLALPLAKWSFLELSQQSPL